MRFLRYQVDLRPGDIVEVTLDAQAQVELLDQANFDRFRRGQDRRGVIVAARTSPVRMTAPRAGRWFVVIHLAGRAGTISASCRVLQTTRP